jgi:hypothetical protein
VGTEAGLDANKTHTMCQKVTKSIFFKIFFFRNESDEEELNTVMKS